MGTLYPIEPAKFFFNASIATSVILPFTAMTERFDIFAAATFLNFALFHMIWLSQILRRDTYETVDFSVIKAPLIAFAVLGNGSLILFVSLKG
ncbi:MAG: hypothetical protein ABR601_05310 [Parasphingopyxis sp.]